MREFEYENQGNGSYLVYKLGAEEELNTFVLGMVSNNNLEGILKMSKVQMDGEVQVRYLISAKRQLAEYLKNERLTRDIILDMLYRIVQTIINAGDYMIRQNEFIMDVKYMYIDINTRKPEIMLTPVKNRGMVSESLDMFVKNFIYSIGYTDEILINTVNKIMGMLNQCNSIVDLRDAIRLEMTHKSIAQPGIAAASAPSGLQQVQAAVQPVKPNPQPMVQSVNQSPQAAAQPSPQAAAQPVKSKAQNQKESLKNVNVPFAVPGMNIPGMNVQSMNVPMQEKKEEPKDKKGIFGLKLGKDKKKEEQQKTVVQSQVQPAKMAMPTNVGQNVVPVVPNNVQMPKQQNTMIQNYNAAGDSNTILMSSYEEDSNPYLYRLKSGENIQITKDYFKIGKSNTQVDYQIANNNAISNFHAAVLRRGEEYFIIDPGSTNHTYVEGTKLEKGQEVKISHDSHIRMANEEFVFKIM